MTIPRIPSLLIMLALGQDALALQMGQITGESVRGQPLVARVTLFGMPANAAGDIDVELLPAFGASLDTLEAYGLRARIDGGAGEQTIIVTSTQPMDLANLALRLRLRDGEHALVRHYELTIPAAPAAPIARSPRAPRAVARPAPAQAQARTPSTPAAVVATEGGTDYGPVRAGQSLWSILEETGAAGADNAERMQEIVAANPDAFVNGDAGRLRVGVTLHLPGGQLKVRPATSTTATPTPDVTRGQQAVDADTAARLARLAVQFEEIKARYAAQQAQAAPVKAEAPPLRTETVAPAPVAKAAPVAAVASPRIEPAPKASLTVKADKPPVAAPPVPERDEGPLAGLSSLVDGRTLVGAGTVLLLIALALGGLRLGRRMRSRKVDAGARNAEQDLVAEIARKTEKRVQLEDEVKRMIAGRIDGADEPARVALKPADLLSGVRGTLEEIETRIAHGQYNEAEAMLEQTIVDTPNNFRAKLRLAEIYYLNERHEEFVDLAEEIHRQHRHDIGDENWARLMRMGKVIAPDRPPFSGPVAVEAGRRAH